LSFLLNYADYSFSLCEAHCQTCKIVCEEDVLNAFIRKSQADSVDVAVEKAGAEDTALWHSFLAIYHCLVDFDA
jgi:hypothetical protein